MGCTIFGYLLDCYLASILIGSQLWSKLTDKATISSTRLVDGEEVTLTCTSPGRCRHIRPQITWEGPITDIRQKMYDVTYGDGSRTFHSNITFTPRKSHNNSALFCKVTFKSNLTTVQKRTMNVVWSELQFIAVMGAAVGGFLLFMLILIGAFLIKHFRKTRHKNIKENLKNSETPEDTVPEDVQFTAEEDSMDMITGDMQYASIDFSKLKPKEDVNENMETEYSEIKKTQQDE
ncbi:uncharacterized protein LOC122932364 [Bufo gargarizans]|uniref:uncharacterized protein LOC122932364 n=1 Tax=Bufo gargarizans TaxID=30331 RepID=UPI001CF51A42|nr:uncharacterized protein LOC122932364 [Bufo gargarizans]